MELLREDLDALYGQGQRHTTAGAYRSEFVGLEIERILRGTMPASLAGRAGFAPG